MNNLESITEYIIGKTQWIRLFDILILGPSMIYAGIMDKKMSKKLRALIFISGTGTIIYNGINFIRQSSINKKYGLGPLESLMEITPPESWKGG